MILNSKSFCKAFQSFCGWKNKILLTDIDFYITVQSVHFNRGKKSNKKRQLRILNCVGPWSAMQVNMFCEFAELPVVKPVNINHRMILEMWLLQRKLAYPLWKRSTLWNLFNSTENSSVPCTSDMIWSHSSPVKRKDTQ